MEFIAAIKMEADNVYTSKSTNMCVVSIYLNTSHLNENYKRHNIK